MFALNSIFNHSDLLEETPDYSMKEYVVNKDKPAFAIIFNNEHFEGKDKRTGTEVDEKSVHSLEQDFAGTIVFHKHTLENLKADEITGAFKMLGKPDIASLNDQEIDGALKLIYQPKDFSRRKKLTRQGKMNLLQKPPIDFDKYSCFMAFIMSHGNEKGISGTNKELFDINALSSHITPKKCKGLKDKPKIFFVQACRGPNRSVVVEDDTEDDTEDELTADSYYEEDDDEAADGILFSYIVTFLACINTDIIIVI